MYVYVKTLLQVTHGKYSTSGVVEWQIQHEAKPDAIFDIRFHPKFYIFHKS